KSWSVKAWSVGALPNASRFTLHASRSTLHAFRSQRLGRIVLVAQGRDDSAIAGPEGARFFVEEQGQTLPLGLFGEAENGVGPDGEVDVGIGRGAGANAIEEVL